MSDFDLNALVDLGKDDVLAFIKNNIFTEAPHALVCSQFFLSVKKQHAPLDIIRTRALVIQENEALLGQIKSDDPYVGFAMARAAGRVSQMKECLIAVERMMAVEDDESRIEAMEGLKFFLLELEKMSVRFHRLEDGRFELLSLDAVYGQAQRASACVH